MIVKLANKLTKVFNSLSEVAQQRVEPLLRPEKTFVLGIEKGNRRLLSALQKHIKKSLKFENVKDGEFISRAGKQVTLMGVAKHPRTLEEALGKRHEIFEAQQITGQKKLSKKLRKIDNLPDYENNLDILRNRMHGLRKYYRRSGKDPALEDRIDRAMDYVLSRMYKNSENSKVAPSIRSQFFTHRNPQVLVNESQLMRGTPKAFKTSTFQYRHQSGEVDALKNQFNIVY